MSLAARRALAAAAILLAAASVARLAQERAWRRVAASLAAAAGAPAAAAASLEPAGDLAAAFLVGQALEKAGPAPPDELRRLARRPMLEAAAFRPGWAEHRYLLGLSDEDPGGPRARRVLRLAAAAAPGETGVWEALARADLAAWPSLPAAQHATLDEDFRRAMRSEDFVSDHYPEVEAALGPARARALLPEDAAVLSQAAGGLAEKGDVPGAAAVMAREVAAERRERERELADLERLGALGDSDGLRRRCRAWFERHPYQEQDDAEGRRQLARLLAVWPNDRYGGWARDPRARLVRFFLEGRLSDVPPATLLRTLEILTAVPDPARARVLVAAGRLAEARAISRGALFSAEWDDYLIELAGAEIGAGRVAEANTALSRLSFAVREGCDALLTRRRLARALPDAAAAAAIEAKLAALREPAPVDLAARGAVPVCVDPEWSDGRRLRVVAPPGPPALLAWGWDGGRGGVISVPENGATLVIPLTKFAGQRTFWMSLLAGGSGRSLLASVGGPA